MAARVSLRRMVEEFDALTDETSAYLNRETGELYALGNEEAGLVEDGIDSAELPDGSSMRSRRSARCLSRQTGLRSPHASTSTSGPSWTASHAPSTTRLCAMNC